MSESKTPRIESMTRLLDAVVTITTKSDKEVSGRLVRVERIDKQIFLNIARTKSQGGDIYLNFDQVASFTIDKLPKPPSKPKYANLPCKGKRDVEGCKFPMQQFEALCQTCPHRMSKFVAPQTLAEAKRR